MNQFTLKDYVYPKKTNWVNIISDIVESGIKISQIPVLLGVGWSTFQKWNKGTEPKYSIGVSLLTLHARQCGEDLTRIRISESPETVKKDQSCIHR